MKSVPRALAREREKVGWVRDVTQHSHVIGRSCTCCSPPQFQYNNFLESINNDFVFLYWSRDAIKKTCRNREVFFTLRSQNYSWGVSVFPHRNERQVRSRLWPWTYWQCKDETLLYHRWERQRWMFSCREKLSDVQELGTEHLSAARVKTILKKTKPVKAAWHTSLCLSFVCLAWWEMSLFYFCWGRYFISEPILKCSVMRK